MTSPAELEFNEYVLVLAGQWRKAKALRPIGEDAGFERRTIDSVAQLRFAVQQRLESELRDSEQILDVNDRFAGLKPGRPALWAN